VPQFTYQPRDKKYDVPEDTYRVKFLGSKDRPPFDGPSRFGKPNNDPRLEWEFEVVEGPQAGKIISQTTGSSPAHPKSGCYKMVRGLLGRKPEPGEPIDTDVFRGRLYEVRWEENPESESGNLHIAEMKPLASGPACPPAQPVAQPPAQQPARKGPPPRPANAAPPAAEPEPNGVFYCAETGEQAFSFHELQTWISANARDIKTLEVAKEGEAEWKSAAAFGFKDRVPF
jgi:hypothetical protein